jgi:cytoskeletal protein CcmA (bactofilin family)
MFSKGTPKAAQDNVPSIISGSTQIVGDITTDGEVQVDGKIEGNIRCHTLIVAESGEVTGKVISESATIHGTLTGTVQSKSVTLSSSARVVGDLTHETLTVEPGAHLKGQCIPVDSKLDSKKDGVVLLAGARPSTPLPSQKPKEAAQG